MYKRQLLDPASYPSPETSCTTFIVYSIAYGINEGLLDNEIMVDKKKYPDRKVLDKESEKVFDEKTGMLSHHGIPDFGSPIRPMFLEAVILSSLDNLDANIFEISNAVSATKTGEFTDRIWALDNRKLYNHGRTNNTEYSVDFGDKI